MTPQRDQHAGTDVLLARRHHFPPPCLSLSPCLPPSTPAEGSCRLCLAACHCPPAMSDPHCGPRHGSPLCSSPPATSAAWHPAWTASSSPATAPLPPHAPRLHPQRRLCHGAALSLGLPPALPPSCRVQPSGSSAETSDQTRSIRSSLLLAAPHPPPRFPPFQAPPPFPPSLPLHPPPPRPLPLPPLPQLPRASRLPPPPPALSRLSVCVRLLPASPLRPENQRVHDQGHHCPRLLPLRC